MLFIAILFILVILISFIFNTLLIKLSLRFNIFIDKNTSKKPQKIHSISTPRVGGLGIFTSFLILMFILIIYPRLIYFLLPHAQMIFINLLISSSIIFLSGFLEDVLNSLSPKIRLSIQSMGVLYGLLSLGAFLYDLNIGFELPFILALLFSIFCVVGCINAMNIIDGLNGLSSGVGILVLLSISFVAYESGNNDIFIVSLFLSGSILGFILLNFPFGKIFIGDGGAYFNGFIIAILLIMLTQSSRNISAWYGFLVMIYPVWEVLFSIYRRKKSKKRAMHPDGAHLHQLLLKITNNNAISTLFIWIFNIPFLVLGSIFYYSTIVCIGLSFLFISIYIIIYNRLSNL